MAISLADHISNRQRYEKSQLFTDQKLIPQFLKFQNPSNSPTHMPLPLSSPSWLHLQLADILVPMHSANVLELPLPLWFRYSMHRPGRPHQVRVGAHLNYVLSFQIWMFRTPHQIHVVTIYKVRKIKTNKFFLNINFTNYKLNFSGCLGNKYTTESIQ